jgi:hypothetical protein
VAKRRFKIGATIMGRNMFGGQPGPWDARKHLHRVSPISSSFGGDRDGSPDGTIVLEEAQSETQDSAFTLQL